MSAATDTMLDQATRDELQPTCESGQDKNAATRISHWHTHCSCFPPHRLYCTNCAQRITRLVNASVAVLCRECQRPVRLLRIEPLR